MCFSSTKTPPVVTRPDPNIKYVDGNTFDPKASPQEIDTTPVVSDKKKKSSETLFSLQLFFSLQRFFGAAKETLQ